MKSPLSRLTEEEIRARDERTEEILRDIERILAKPRGEPEHNRLGCHREAIEAFPPMVNFTNNA